MFAIKTIVILIILLISISLIQSAPAYPYTNYGSGYYTNSGVPYAAISGNWGGSSWDNSIVSHAFGTTEDYGSNVGHAIHSITVRTLKKFNPNVTEDNRVPTINMDLASDSAILPYAPDRSGPDSYKLQSEGMKILDEVSLR
uniref:Uncharacterized protein n=1 Tax=Panagrolaimus sp. ES5 TaxID=591445 RepID=A0AC34FQU7_9BILA